MARAARSVVRALVALYTAITFAAWIYLLVASDATPPGMLLAFGPRWVLTLPWVVLLPLSLVLPRRWATLSFLGTTVAVLGLAQFELPNPRRTRGVGATFRLVTYSTDGASTLPSRIRSDLSRWDADVVVLQVCRTNLLDSLRSIRPPSLHTGRSFCLASKWPLLGVDSLFAAGTERAIAVRYRLQSPTQRVTVYSVHLSSPRTELWAARNLDFSGLRRSIATRAGESLDLARWVGNPVGPTLVAGDFNATYGSRIMRDRWSGWQDAFAEVGTGFGYTMYAGRFAVRIDQALSNALLTPEQVTIERNVPSEHRPLVVDFRFVQAQ